MDKLQSERLEHFPNVNSLLKISLGLVLFTIISSALVYAETLSVDIEGNSFDIDYTATGMTVSGIEPDLTFFSLILTVDVTDSTGILNITFERSFLDSTFEGADDDFLIINQFGEEVNFTETETTSQSRTLSIEVLAGTTDIEIIGTIFGDSSSTEDADKAAADKAAADKAAADKAAADKAAADKAAADAKVSQTQCGPGTILKNGACELDERCGPGTVLKDGACVLDSTPKSSETSVNIISRELITGVVVALGIAGAIGIILGIISKVSKSKN
ncbi:MAG: hypothetical protein QQN55_06020 [Nitrosopumilus sp.]